MLRMTKQGFTLIELMVVIVIIGVLASLAIPRFTDASNKAKVAEAPRVLASFESSYLAMVAEGQVAQANQIFQEPNDSKWFTYTAVVNGNTQGEDLCNADVKAGKMIGPIAPGKLITTSYLVDTDGKDSFSHAAANEYTKYIPNFMP